MANQVYADFPLRFTSDGTSAQVSFPLSLVREFDATTAKGLDLARTTAVVYTGAPAISATGFSAASGVITITFASIIPAGDAVIQGRAIF